MESNQKRVLSKLLLYVGVGYLAYKIANGFSNKKSPEKIIKETVAPVTKAISEVKKIAQKFVKGSPEAKAHMASIRAKISDKAKAGKLGGEATARLGEHKGHSTKKGLIQDTKYISSQEHEKHYKKTKINSYKKTKINSYKKGGVVKETGLALVHKGEVVIPTEHKESILDKINNGKK
jgi:hypothetical protein